MRWMMLALLVSLTALLLAAAGVAHHIWRRRSQKGNEPHHTPGTAQEPAEEIEMKSEP
jgi:hypothetical protein